MDGRITKSCFSFLRAWIDARISPPVQESSDEQQADGSSDSFRPSSFPRAGDDFRILPPVLESSDEQADGFYYAGRFVATSDKENRKISIGSHIEYASWPSFVFNRRFDATSDKENRKNSMESHIESPSSRFLFFYRQFVATSDKENRKNSMETPRKALADSLTYQAGLNSPWGFRSGTESEGSGYFNRKNSMESHREYAQGNYVQLPEALAASVIYQAGLNPPGGSWSGTESKHSRCQGSNKQFKEETTSWKLFSCTLAIALFCSLPDLFEAFGIPLQAKAAGTWMVAIALFCTLLNLFDAIKYYFCASDHMVDNAVSEAAPTWQLLSGSTHHATGNRALLHNYETVHGLNIQLGDGMSMPVSGRGTVVMDTVVLPDVWFVPELKKNIVSVSQLAELDCNIVFKRDACYISNATDGSIIGKALARENWMFKLEFLKVPLDN